MATTACAVSAADRRDGPEDLALEAQARELQLPGITFRGRLGRAGVIETVKGVRFMIVPSTWYEGFSDVDCRVLLHAEPRCGARDCEDLGKLLACQVEWTWNHPVELAEMGRGPPQV